MVLQSGGSNSWLVEPCSTDGLEQRALVGKATATPKSKSPEKRKSKSPLPRRRVLDNADFVIHGLRTSRHRKEQRTTRGLKEDEIN
jgi:hypothetical protein